MADRLSIEGKCDKCGGTTLSIPSDVTDNAWITCDSCGENLITWGQFKADLAAAAKDDLTGRFK